MFDSIGIGTTGLIGFSKQLQTISNNVTNLNTPGFKQSQSEFSALFSQGGGGASAGQSGAQGSGLALMPAVTNFAQGAINQTGNNLDAAVSGEGFFVLKGRDGELRYTRNGEFEFDADGFLVSRGDGNQRVQGLGDKGQLQDISLAGLKSNPAKASTAINLVGGLSTVDTLKTVSGITVFDQAGGSHTLTAEFRNNTAVTAGSWLVTIKEGTITVGTGEIRFSGGLLDPAFKTVSFNYAIPNIAIQPLTLNMDANATGATTGASTLALSSVDGYGVGSMTQTSFDTEGRLVLTYSNGQTVKIQRLALATVDSPDSLEAITGNSYRVARAGAVAYGPPRSGVTTITGGALEASNVDLSSEFSEIIVAQRGYQAASELVSTANQMLDTLLQMKN